MAMERIEDLQAFVAVVEKGSLRGRRASLGDPFNPLAAP